MLYLHKVQVLLKQSVIMADGLFDFQQAFMSMCLSKEDIMHVSL